MFSGRLVRDEQLEQINRNLQRRGNGGMTGGDAVAALIVMGFRKMPRTVRRVLVTVILLFIAWCFLGETIVGLIHKQ
jgi:hypothetical protein